jgi:hypothetical protein
MRAFDENVKLQKSRDEDVRHIDEFTDAQIHRDASQGVSLFTTESYSATTWPIMLSSAFFAARVTSSDSFTSLARMAIPVTA